MTELARTVFANDRYATEATGIDIEEVSVDKVVCRLDIKPHHRNAKGAVMGGVLFTLADFAFAIAANSEMLPAVARGDCDLQWVSVSSQINFLAQPKGDTLYAITKRLRQGRSQALFQISVYDGYDRLLAFVTTSGSRIS